MKFIALGFFILNVAPQIIGQEPLHLSGNTITVRANIGLTADSIERQDPPGASSDAYATVFHLRGNVVVRACCMQKGLAENQPKSAVFMRGDDAVYHGDTGEIEFRGNSRVSFQDYGK